MSQPSKATFDSGSTTTNASSYVTTSKTFLANTLYIIGFGASGTNVATPSSVRFTAAGTAWTQVVAGASGSTNGQVCLYFIVVGGSNVTDTVTIGYGAQAITGFDWIINSVAGALGSSLSSLFPQSATANGSSASPSAALAAGPAGSSLTGGYCFGPNSAFTAGTNFTKLVETAGHSTPAGRSAIEYDNGAPQQTANWTITSGTWFALAFEVAASAVTDSGTGSATASGSRSFEATVDAGSGTSSAAGARSFEGFADTGSGTFSAAGSRSFEALADLGSGTASTSGSRSFEAIAEGGTSALTGSSSGTGNVVGGTPADSGTASITVVATGAEVIADASTASTSGSGSSAGEALADGGGAGMVAAATGTTSTPPDGPPSVADSSSGRRRRIILVPPPPQVRQIDGEAHLRIVITLRAVGAVVRGDEVSTRLSLNLAAVGGLVMAGRGRLATRLSLGTSAVMLRNAAPLDLRVAPALVADGAEFWQAQAEREDEELLLID